MGVEETRQLMFAMIEQHDQCAASKQERQLTTKARDAARDALAAEVMKAGGALRVDATRLLRMQDVPSRRCPRVDHVETAVGNAHASDITPDTADTAPQRLAESVFQHLKPQLWPKIPRLALSTSCPRGLKRDALTQLPDSLAPQLRTYEDNNIRISALRKRRAADQLDRSDPQLLQQLRDAGGTLRYGLTVNGERRAATLAVEPAKVCELLVKEVQSAVRDVADAVFADMEDKDVEDAWQDATTRARFSAKLWDELVARRERKRASVPRRVALRRLE